MSTVKISMLPLLACLPARHKDIYGTKGKHDFVSSAFSRPMVKYVANIHGDEAVTRELLLGLAHYLVWNYGTDQRVTQLLNKTEVKEHKLVFRREFSRLCSM